MLCKYRVNSWPCPLLSFSAVEKGVDKGENNHLCLSEVLYLEKIS